MPSATLSPDRCWRTKPRKKLLPASSGSSLGTVTATGISAGGEYTCLGLSNGTAQCTGRNQFGQHADGTLNNSSVLVPNSLANVARVVAVGLVVGAGGALASGKLVTSFLYGLTPSDPGILALAAAVLAVVALAAGLAPALRASRVDPVAALRED